MGHIINIHSGLHTAVERTEAYKALIENIRKIPQLQPEQERRILEEYLSTTDNNRKIELRNILINANQTFVLAAVKQYCGNNVEVLLDLIGEANIGFIEAIEDYNPTKTKKDGKLISWAAFYIRRAINQYLCRRSLVRQSNNAVMHHKLSKARSILIQRFQREPTEEELVEYLSKEENIAVQDIRDVVKMNISSVDIGVDDDEYNSTLAVFNSATAYSNSVENLIENDYTNVLVKKSLKTLSERDRQIIEMLYGLGEYCISYSYEVVAKQFNFSEERIRQIHINALKTMAKAARRASVYA